MLTIEGSGLRAHLLDPLADRSRLGSRYVAGGYIWQVEDLQRGDLVSGPAYPKPDPGGFDGQGLPEVFEIALGAERAPLGGEVHVIGVGRVKRDSPVKPFHVRNNFTVLEFSPWTHEQSAEGITFASDQAFREWSLRLIRTVRLEGRMLVSETTLRNTGSAEIPVRWFAHPFFPPAGPECFHLGDESAFPAWVADAGGFRINERGWVERKAAHDWKKGCYQLVQIPFGYPLVARVRHPILGEMKVEADFPTCFLPVWANEKTQSFEPYLQTQVSPGAGYSWAMRYHF